MKIVLALGGSNMEGRGKGGPALNTVSSRVRVWNNVNGGGAVGTAFIAAPATGSAPWDANGGNNSAAWFCDRLAKEQGDDVRLILVAQGSLYIADMAPPTGERYVKVRNTYAATGAGPADFLLWNNGDAIIGTDLAAYEAAFLKIIAALKTGRMLSPTAIVVVQGLVGTQSGLNDNLAVMAARNTNMVFAPSTDLRPADDVHLCGPDLHYMGFHRCWQAYQQFAGPRIVPGRPLLGAF